MVEEIYGLLVTPILLLVYLPAASIDICNFLRNTLYESENLGDWCSLGCFELDKTDPRLSRDGKIEKSALSFAFMYRNTPSHDETLTGGLVGGGDDGGEIMELTEMSTTASKRPNKAKQDARVERQEEPAEVASSSSRSKKTTGAAGGKSSPGGRGADESSDDQVPTTATSTTMGAGAVEPTSVTTGTAGAATTSSSRSSARRGDVLDLGIKAQQAWGYPMHVLRLCHEVEHIAKQRLDDYNYLPTALTELGERFVMRQSNGQYRMLSPAQPLDFDRPIHFDSAHYFWLEVYLREREERRRYQREEDDGGYYSRPPGAMSLGGEDTAGGGPHIASSGSYDREGRDIRTQYTYRYASSATYHPPVMPFGRNSEQVSGGNGSYYRYGPGEQDEGGEMQDQAGPGVQRGLAPTNMQQACSVM
ncbi:unnamed protein product [Amoebophrya sp. A25]|nr:unnamed protein product [Amoebophrya sp. A25]|eukprot:GSA25T00025058001.1